ncbi:hypothetical protein EX895_003813 [Sporisorium graminicola]|uniref:Uncharacterized protein n=1 Tax=Sporisorium graminicola TaxID=280036 RepID=A0A4U7KST0_9BASI|nr:hypothetical protein EX895_003813 [Sporisorium graminicola]TKY87136.1 hypothetical protein EX895_003813 [Sporisorium graminicola]
MNWISLTPALTLSYLILTHAAFAKQQHRMFKLHARQQAGAAAAEQAADPGLQLTEDSDADMSLHYDESMRLFMRSQAEAVIASHAGVSFSAYEAECILKGALPSLHPGTLSNVSWTMDMFESGTVLPTASSPVAAAAPQTFSLMSTDGTASLKNTGEANLDINHVIDVDHLLDSFFHADAVKSTFDKVQAETNQNLDKQTKKAIIKQTAPVLHKTIEKVASHRGWGLQDARFAQMHLDDDPQLQLQQAGGAVQAKVFQDYDTFVKTMRSALLTPLDAAKDVVQEQQETPRQDPASKA